MTEVVVLGSNSFSGSHFVKYCLAQGVDVAGISRSPEPIEAFLPYQWQKSPGAFSFHQLDMNHDLPAIASLIKKLRPKYVVNFAAQGMVAQSWEAPEQWFQTNTLSAVQLHDCLRTMDFLERFVQVSTPEVYGHCEGVVTENRQYLPSTPYAVSKAAIDMSLHSFFQSYDFPVVYTRSANVYGPGQPLYRILPRAVISIKNGEKLPLHGGGISQRNFIHIDDVVNATWKIATEGHNGDIYHIASEKLISIRDLVETVCRQMHVDFSTCVDVAPERLGKDAVYHLSSDKLRTQLKWEPTVALDDGITQVVNWIDEHYGELCKLPLDYQHKP
jgi:dTDP-glucose 4,6-dehydratase